MVLANARDGRRSEFGRVTNREQSHDVDGSGVNMDT